MIKAFKHTVKNLAFALITLAFHSPAFAACSNPTGSASDMMYNLAAHVPQYCNNTNWIAMGPAYYVANGITFNGSTNLARTGATLGGTDGKTFTGNFWVRLNALGGTPVIFYQYTNIFTNYVSVSFTASNYLQVAAVNTSTVLNVTTTTAISDTNWHHIAFSFDMSDTAKRHIMIDGVASGLTVGTYSDATIDFNHNNNYVGSANALYRLNGDLADFWLETGVYMDLTNATNMAKFRDSYGRPANLGSSGQTPNAGAPDVFLSGTLASPWNTNKGTGAGFTVAAGSLSAAASSPSEKVLGSDCSSPTGTEGAYFYNVDYNVMQYCNGLNWIAMGPVIGAGGGSCSSPSGTAGKMIYNSDYTALQYCNGTSWIKIGN